MVPLGTSLSAVARAVSSEIFASFLSVAWLSCFVVFFWVVLAALDCVAGLAELFDMVVPCAPATAVVAAMATATAITFNMLPPKYVLTATRWRGGRYRNHVKC